MPEDIATRFISTGAAQTRRPARVLPKLTEFVEADEPEDAAVARVETRLAELLGKPAAAMFPTGTMAQQVALRVHADRRGVRTVAFHPQCHLEVHEEKGYAAVHGLTAALIGDPHTLIKLDDLMEVRQPIAALLLELPQRDLGGQLPEWDDLVAQTEWARGAGAAVHMDGARLWEAQPFYDRPHAEIAALFDTVYVSLYKGLMGISGAVLAGEVDVIRHATVWRQRLGGDVTRNWPMAVLAERGLAELLPRMAGFTERARTLSALLSRIPGIEVVPDPPVTPMFHLHFDAAPAAVAAATAQLREINTLAGPRYVSPSSSPNRCSVEIMVSEHLDEATDAEIGDLFAELIKRARG